MRRHFGRVAFCALALGIELLAGCASVRTTKAPRVGAPILAPTDPAQIELLRHAPRRPYIRLGRIRATPEGGADEQQIEAALRAAAASMGATAVVIEDDSGDTIQASAIVYRQ